MGRNGDYVYKVIEGQQITDTHPKNKSQSINRYCIVNEIK